MDRLKQLIHEIHRRSLWQVLGIYIFGGWVVLQVVDTVTSVMQLPDWAPTIAALLLLVGLPIVMATAFVQEGIGTSRSTEPTKTPERFAAGAEAPTLFTWRNAIAGAMRSSRR